LIDGVDSSGWVGLKCHFQHLTTVVITSIYTSQKAPSKQHSTPLRATGGALSGEEARGVVQKLAVLTPQGV